MTWIKVWVMFSNYLNFLRFLNYLKNHKCEENPYFEDITKISSDNRGRCLVKSDKLMLNFENIRNDLFANQKIKPSTVDGLYSNFDKNRLILSLYFVEFKGSELSKLDFNRYFGDNILPLTDEQCVFNDRYCPINNLNKKVLEKIYERFDDKVSTNLKLKPFESLFVIFPKICEDYANKSGYSYSVGDFYTFLLKKIRCHLIVVYKSGKNHINDEKTTAADIRDKYRVLKNNNLITSFQVYDERDFKDNLLNDIRKFPFSFLEVIINVSDSTLNKTNIPSEFGEIIGVELKKYLNKNNIVICDYSKEILRRVISKCCMDYIIN